MTSASVPAPFEDPADRDPASGDENLAAGFATSDLKAIRQAHLREEGYVKAVGRVSYLCAVVLERTAPISSG